MAGCNRIGTTGTGSAPFEGTPLIVGLPTPHAVLLTGLHRPVQAGLGDFTAVADSSCLLDLEECRAGVPDGEEQLRVLFQAGSTVTPRHQCSLLRRLVLPIRMPQPHYDWPGPRMCGPGGINQGQYGHPRAVVAVVGCTLAGSRRQQAHVTGQRRDTGMSNDILSPEPEAQDLPLTGRHLLPSRPRRGGDRFLGSPIPCACLHAQPDLHDSRNMLPGIIPFVTWAVEVGLRTFALNPQSPVRNTCPPSWAVNVPSSVVTHQTSPFPASSRVRYVPVTTGMFKWTDALGAQPG
jgi:hypothetical protein